MQKVLFTILSFVLWCQIAQSQSLPQAKRGTNAIRLNIEDNNFSSGQTFSKLSLKLPITDLKGQHSTFDTRDFKLKEQNPETDPYGLQHYHYTQTINGIEVDGAEMRVHVKNGTVESQTGSWLLEVTPRLQALRASQSADAILQAVENSLKGKKISSQTLTTVPVGNSANARVAAIPDNAKLVYVPIGRDLENISPDSVRLAYRFTVKTAPFGNFMYYVDATNGELLYKIDMVCRIMGNKQHTHTVACDADTATSTKTSKTSSPTITETDDPKSTLWTQYSGSQRTTTTKRSDGKWSLKDLSRNIEVLFLDSLDNETGTKIYSKPYLNNSNQWRLKSDKDFDGFAYDVLWGSQVTYDYFKNNLGKWLYTSGKFGQKLTVYANTDFLKLDPNSPNSVNAFYSGENVVIGMGDPKNGINPLSTLDVVAHEIVHGITASTSGLQYINESGAINEALSDIFGTAVERYKRPQRWNWTMGEDIGLIIRSMSNPVAYQQPGEYGGKYFLNYATHFDIDNGGVHINSGIMNRWFYLLCEGGKGTNEAGNAYDVQAIGMDDAIKIVWLAQQQYITSRMSFFNVSNATFRAARAIFGENANQTRQLQNAWYAVNVSKEILSNVCPDNNEPNNDFKTATPLTIGKPISGSMGDFVKSGYNANLSTDTTDVEIPNDQQYADWFEVKTTDSHPNLKLTLKTYFSDVMTVALHEKKGNSLEIIEERATNDASYHDDFSITIDQKTLETKTDISNNDVKAKTYYIEVIHGYGSGNASLDFLSATSNGCYELTTYTSSKPYPQKPAPGTVSAINRMISKSLNKKMVHLMNINDKETKYYKFLSLPNDVQIANNAPVQRNYDNYGDQIWQMIPSSSNTTEQLFYKFKNLNTDKVIEVDSKTNKLFMGDINLNPNKDAQDFSIYATMGFQQWTSRTTALRMSVKDALTGSPVVIAKSYCGDNICSKQTWVSWYARLTEPGQYILRSVKDKKALTLINGKTLQAKTFTEESTQKWNLVYDKDGRYVITSAATGKAINLTNGNAAENATYDLATPNTKQETQRWKVLPTGADGSFKLANSSNNKTLNSKTNETIAQNTYNGSSEQRWYLDKIEKIKEGYYFLQNRANSLYMDVTASLKQDGATMLSYPYNGSYNQLFYVQPQTDGTYIIEAVHSEKAISTNALQKLAQPYQWETDANKPNQRWQIIYTSDGYFKIISKFNGMAMQAGKEANQAGSKTPIVLNTYLVGNQQQQWKFNILGSVVDKTVQTLTENTLSDSYNAEQGMLSISPNPAENEVSIAYDLSADEEANVKLLTSTGMPIMHKTAGKKETILDISQVPTGVYLISLETNTGKKITQKLVVQK